MDYDFKEIESKWQARWTEEKTFKAGIDKDKPKFYDICSAKLSCL